MKTSLTKILLTSTLAVAAAAFIALPFRSVAADNVKGGQRLIALTAPAATAAAATAPAAMSCGSCKDKAVAYDASGKGSVKDLRTAMIHHCPSCASAIKTVGFGKAKTDVVAHSCSLEVASAACCK